MDDNKAIITTEEGRKNLVDLYVNKKRSVSFLSMYFRTTTDKVRATLIELGIELRRTRKQLYEKSLKVLLEKEFETDEFSFEELAMIHGCTEQYVRNCYNQWNRKKKAEEEKPPDELDPFLFHRFGQYLTLDKLRKFAETIKIGDRINMRKDGRDLGHDSYLYSYPGRRKTVVTVLAKYPHFAVTDHGAKLWVDLWDAVRRYGKAKQ